MELGNTNLYRISISFLSQMFKDGLLSEQEYSSTIRELQDIYNMDESEEYIATSYWPGDIAP